MIDIILLIGVSAYVIFCFCYIIKRATQLKTLILDTPKINQLLHDDSSVCAGALAVSANCVESASIQELLNYMTENHMPTEHATAFIKLIEEGYVNVQFTGNEGDKYNDRVQVERFISSLTDTAIKTLKSLGDEYI